MQSLEAFDLMKQFGIRRCGGGGISSVQAHCWKLFSVQQRIFQWALNASQPVYNHGRPRPRLVVIGAGSNCSQLADYGLVSRGDNFGG